MEKRIIDYIPVELHEQLIKEVLELIEAEKKEEEKKKAKVQPTKQEIEALVNNIM